MPGLSVETYLFRNICRSLTGDVQRVHIVFPGLETVEKIIQGDGDRPEHIAFIQRNASVVIAISDARMRIGYFLQGLFQLELLLLTPAFQFRCSC